MNKIRFCRIYGYVTAAALAAAALCLGVQCFGIYRTGEFTPEKVAAAFRPISFAVYLALALSLGSVIASLFSKGEKQKPSRCKPTPLPKAFPNWLRYAALGAAIGLILFGYFAGGTVDVLTKAVNICTECVGLG